MKFSQRYGYTPASKAIQKESLDTETRNSLWNMLCLIVFDNWAPRQLASKPFYSRPPDAQFVDAIVLELWVDFFKWPVDSMPEFKQIIGSGGASDQLRNSVLHGEWYEVLDLIQAVIKSEGNIWSEKLQNAVNRVLEKESTAYRVVGKEIVEITSEVEIESIELGIESNIKEVSIHLKSALAKLADRKTPDYRNSIKESISAVEAACQVYSGSPGATLGDCLKAIRKHRTLHSAFEQAFSKLYGFTSDSGGIRHALLDGASHPTAADAKFMLVACSAFTNYLWTIAAESKDSLE